MLFNRVAQMYRSGETEKAWRVVARRATILRIQAAADMFALSPRDEWSVWSDFPITIPPWPVTWAEWRTPARVVVGGETRAMSARGDVGALVECRRVPSGWQMWVACYGEVGWIGAFQVALDINGKPVAPATGPWAGKVAFHINLNRWPTKDERLLTASILMGWGYPTLLALSLCHCRNTTLVEHTVPDALVKKHQRRGHDAVSRYYTLEIEPMRRALKQAGSDHSLRRALHLCRGHFKDYREGPGLFGRLRGLWWWDMQVRGDAAWGQVGKDYAVAETVTAEESHGR